MSFKYKNKSQMSFSPWYSELAASWICWKTKVALTVFQQKEDKAVICLSKIVATFEGGHFLKTVHFSWEEYKILSQPSTYKNHGS